MFQHVTSWFRFACYGIALCSQLYSAELPNIVVFSDDHGYWDSTVYGATDVRTPNMQRMATEGVTFTHAFVASPACAPSRAALLTGLMPARKGAEANHTYCRDGIRTLPSYLKDQLTVFREPHLIGPDGPRPIKPVGGTLQAANENQGHRQPRQKTALLDKENLVAWCIVPFDARGRGPAARAEMVSRLGIKRVAYDWRDKDIPSFEQEILEYKRRGLEYFAFWSWHPDMVPLVKKHDIHPQFWIMCPEVSGDSQQAKVANAVEQLLPQVRQTRELGCQLGLYNHGGWGGEPQNMVAICQQLKQQGHDHVGIVYNFHHGHDHIAVFDKLMKLMKPHLICLNLNGMNDGANPKILPIGDGQHEQKMIQTVLDSGYDGPIGILDHRPELDAEESLRLNLQGLAKVRQQLRSP